MRLPGLEKIASDLILHRCKIRHIVFERLAGEYAFVHLSLGCISADTAVHHKAKSLGKMALADGTHGESLSDLIEREGETCTYRIQMLIELGTHLLHLGIRFGLDGREHGSLLSFEDHRMSEAFATQIGTSRVVGVIDPDPRRLIFNI